ncbi:hypothetical protein [Serratia marcescens]|uniref:hypothetical protein n=1 Tax=Serratia marcescens TaxID=615 RepID=UPI00148D8B7C|nr:hypothetical protein [Serratia marcescens]
MPTWLTIGSAVQKYNFQQADMARALGVHYNTYGKWSRSEQNPPAAVYTAINLLLFLKEKQLVAEWLYRNESFKQIR